MEKNKGDFMKKFNVTGLCIPEKNYMVNISKKLEQITDMIQDEEYFTINQARQYGKTTTLYLLHRALREDYLVLNISFESADEYFASPFIFVQGFSMEILEAMEREHASEELLAEWSKPFSETFPMKDLSRRITHLCDRSEKGVLLFIDEVDKSSDNQIFLNFLGMLRNKYLAARAGTDQTFQSVILASVYDIKNLKLKIRPEAERKYNSPWNVAADFKVDMSFSADEIATMLHDYERDHQTGMDIREISEELYRCTGGYPLLVSRLCKWIDEDGNKIWTMENLKNAQKELLRKRNVLFDDLIKNVENHPDLKELISNILCDGVEQGYNPLDSVMQLGTLFGIFVEKNGKIAISNRIFEILLYDYMISMRERESRASAGVEALGFIKDGRLDMPLVLTRFQSLMKSEYRTEDETFLEQQGRLLFLCFLKPIINGTGFYYVEPETRNSTRMDIVVSYGGEEHIIELKIWHGDSYRKNGLQQLEGYMNSREAECGYLVSFSFSKDKEYTSHWLEQDETRKKIFEVVV
ncbi:MAG: hypothetical protein IJ733_05420 [Lachnospiraceae bacterium]|nr:hypothetical protein [Lachnospiraceae bacterium]